jgi:hypothetical protein
MRFRSYLLLVGLLSMGALLALLLRSRLDARSPLQPLSVPAGDQEVAWFSTSTSYSTWERFVAGAKRSQREFKGLIVDDSRAFPERSTDVPELVLNLVGREGNIHIRWYKLSDAANTRNWVDALAERNPPPLAIIGGDTSDRARDLARAIVQRERWHGSPPLFFITTATVDELRPEDDPDKPSETPLLEVYPGRTFRFCFSNRQMARAVYDFVYQHPNLRPRGPIDTSVEAIPNVLPMFGPSVLNELGSKALLMAPQNGLCFLQGWKDDPYSTDFNAAFAEEPAQHMRHLTMRSHTLPYSVGTFDEANWQEQKRALEILHDMPLVRTTRTLLVLPASARSARRFLRTLTGDSPLIGRRLVVVTGDSISFNTVYRDSEIMWNVRDLPVPLVFFAHQNPVAWDDYLPPPNGTDEVLQADEIVRVLVEGSYAQGSGLLRDSDSLAEQLRHRTEIPVFDEFGNRHSGGEFILYFEPKFQTGGRVQSTASLTVWRRSLAGPWESIRERPLIVPPPDAGSLYHSDRGEVDVE